MSMFATIFVQPMTMGQNSLFLVLPLMAVVGLVYKAIRVKHLRQLPLAVLWIWAYMLAGTIALALSLMLLVHVF
jgi:hypothetical protein